MKRRDNDIAGTESFSENEIFIPAKGAKDDKRA